MRPGRAADHSPSSSAAIMEEQSYTSTHPLGHTGPVTGSLYLFNLHYNFKQSSAEDMWKLLPYSEFISECKKNLWTVQSCETVSLARVFGARVTFRKILAFIIKLYVCTSVIETNVPPNQTHVQAGRTFQQTPHEHHLRSSRGQADS